MIIIFLPRMNSNEITLVFLVNRTVVFNKTCKFKKKDIQIISKNCKTFKNTSSIWSVVYVSVLLLHKYVFDDSTKRKWEKHNTEEKEKETISKWINLKNTQQKKNLNNQKCMNYVNTLMLCRESFFSMWYWNKWSSPLLQ